MQTRDPIGTYVSTKPLFPRPYDEMQYAGQQTIGANFAQGFTMPTKNFWGRGVIPPLPYPPELNLMPGPSGAFPIAKYPGFEDGGAFQRAALPPRYKSTIQTPTMYHGGLF